MDLSHEFFGLDANNTKTLWSWVFDLCFCAKVSENQSSLLRFLHLSLPEPYPIFHEPEANERGEAGNYASSES